MLLGFNMDDGKRSRIQELERMRAELARAGQLLDELERRGKAREQRSDLPAPFVGDAIESSDPETRFAACVSSGLAKLGAN